ncbi:MAG: hypothetical protein AAF363_14785 [Bacteroidota bacterium]
MIKIKGLKFVFILIPLGLYNCSKTSNNHLDSDDFDSKEKRIEVLKKEIKVFSAIRDTEFELFNVNGFSNSRPGVPGASSWDYKVVVKVDSADLSNWINGMIRTDGSDYDNEWTTKIIKSNANEWATDSPAEFYIRSGQNVTLIVYRKEGIIFKRMINL